MFEYPYLQFREEEEAENEKEDMISFLNDDFLKWQSHCRNTCSILI